MYQDIADIPGLYKYSINDEGNIDRDGTEWCMTPGGGANHYENPAFADSTFLYIRVVWENNGDFQWYRITWTDLSAGVVVPGSENKMFYGVDGTLLLCEDGTAFDVLAWVWQ